MYFDGYGGEACERITVLNKRTQLGWLRTAALITASGVAVFGALILIKGGKNDKITKSA